MTADIDDLVTSGLAAALTGRSPNTIIMWMATGAITPVLTAGRTRLLRKADVLRVATEKNAHPINVARRRNAEAKEVATA